MKLFSRLSRSASRLGRSKSQAGQEEADGQGEDGLQQLQQAGGIDASASGATAVTAATDAAVAGAEEEVPSMTKLEQTMSDLRVKEGEAGVAAGADDDASMPLGPPGAMGDDSMLRGLSSLDFGAGSSLSFLVGSSIGSETPLPKDGSAGTAVLKGARCDRLMGHGFAGVCRVCVWVYISLRTTEPQKHNHPQKQQQRRLGRAARGAGGREPRERGSGAGRPAALPMYVRVSIGLKVLGTGWN